LQPYLRVALLPYRGRITGGEDFHDRHAERQDHQGKRREVFHAQALPSARKANASI
jgi:hypothetical protein